MNVEELNRQRMEKQVRDASPVFNRDAAPDFGHNGKNWNPQQVYKWIIEFKDKEMTAKELSDLKKEAGEVIQQMSDKIKENNYYKSEYRSSTLKDGSDIREQNMVLKLEIEMLKNSLRGLKPKAKDERVMGNEIKKLALEVAADNGVNNSTGKADSFISKMSKIYNQTFLGKTELKSAMQKEWNKMNVADSKIKDGGYRIEKITKEGEYQTPKNAVGKYAVLYDWVSTGKHFNSLQEALSHFNKVARTKGHEETIESYKKSHRDSKPVTLDEFNRLLRKATK